MRYTIFNRTTMDATTFYSEREALAHVAICEREGDEFNVKAESYDDELGWH